MPGGNAGTIYEQTIRVSGGTMPYTNFVYDHFNAGTTGLVDTEIAANAAAGTFTIIGTPTAAGTATFTIQVTDAAGATLAQNYSIVVTPTPGPLSITPTLVQATPGTNYHQTLTVTGGTQSYTVFEVSVFNGGATGLTGNDISANPTAGTFTINGTPTAAGAATFTVIVTDSAGITLTEHYKLVVAQPLSITASLPGGNVGTVYDQILSVTGGTMPYKNFVYDLFNAGTTGLVDTEITANAATGTFTIDGTPTGAGTATFTINVTDAVGATLAKSFSIAVTTVPGPLTITPTLPQGTAGASYHQTLTVSGGTKSYMNFEVSVFDPGTTGLTAGEITANAATGTFTINGTPTAAGTATFTVNVTDSAGVSLAKRYTITVAPALSITPSLPAGSVGYNYSQVITVSGGTMPFKNFVYDLFTAGTTGLSDTEITANAAAGTFTINGKPTGTGITTFTINVTDAGATLAKNFSIVVSSKAPTVTPLSISGTLAQGTAGTSYHQTLTVSGGTTPYTTFAASEFNAGTTGLTAGEITANASAGTFTINGTPTAAGTATFTVNVADSGRRDAHQSLQHYSPAAPTQVAALAVANLTTTQWTTNVWGFTGTMTISGGAGPYSIVASSGLPTGLTAVVNGSTISFSKSPSVPGTYGNGSITIQDASGNKVTKTFSIKINPPLFITHL